VDVFTAPKSQIPVLDTAFTSHLGEGYNPVCCYYLILGRRIFLKIARKKQARRERYLKRMKSRFARANVKKIRRLEEARALAGTHAKT
jgi:hypothetical protein